MLVAAKRLVGREGIAVASDIPSITYVHLMFEGHRIVTANGAPAESLLAGPMAMAGLPEAARAELHALFPALAAGPPAPALPIARGRGARRLLARLRP